jgi:hypothetical protein
MSEIVHLLTLVILPNEASGRLRQLSPVTHLGEPMSRVPNPPRRCLLNLLTTPILTKSDCNTTDWTGRLVSSPKASVCSDSFRRRIAAKT